MVKGILLAIAASALTATAAMAQYTVKVDPQQIVLTDNPNDPARRIVSIAFDGYIRERTGMQLETAAVDLDGDGVGEIVARFIHTGSCRENMDLCRTVVLRHERGSWAIVLDRLASSKITFYPHHLNVPGALEVDGITWRWGARRYEPRGDNFGDSVSFKPVPQANAKSFASAFGPGAAKLAEGGYGVRFEYSDAKLADDQETLIVRMDGSIACGEATGCPVRILRKDGETWSTILSSSTMGHLSVRDAKRAGYSDVVLQTKNGYVVMGWDGKGSYAVADRIEAVDKGS